MNHRRTAPLPTWVPQCVSRYLAHTETGRSIRDLAREAGCHASTVLRQVRRLESRRDDPLIDAALTTLGQAHFPAQTDPSWSESHKDADPMINRTKPAGTSSSIEARRLEQEGLRVLRRLCESGAVLAVAEDMDKAVVVRDGGTRTAVVDADIAQAMALKDWISCSEPGCISRYTITASGRAALSRMLMQHQSSRPATAPAGCAEAAAPFADQHRHWVEKDMTTPGSDQPRKVRVNLAESPLTLLARRRDRDGVPFLSEDLVRAGERLREDFELAQMGPRVAQNWDRFLTAGGRGGFAPDSGVGSGPSGARDRVTRALSDLGPGLSDVVLRCCCYLEGLEQAEKRLGWSARSGKIVLRIALQRLNQHYKTPEAPRQMVG